MHNDFVRALGYRALDSRLKRISDRMSHDIRKLYKELQIDIEPNWYLIFLLLRDHEKLSIAQIAEKLGYAHPTMVIMVKKMSSKGYVFAQTDSNDKRKQLIQLTEKSRKMLPQLEKLLLSCDHAILQILDNETGILNYLDGIEARLQSNSFYNRFHDEYFKN